MYEYQSTSPSEISFSSSHIACSPRGQLGGVGNERNEPLVSNCQPTVEFRRHIHLYGKAQLNSPTGINFVVTTIFLTPSADLMHICAHSCTQKSKLLLCNLFESEENVSYQEPHWTGALYRLSGLLQYKSSVTRLRKQSKIDMVTLLVSSEPRPICSEYLPQSRRHNPDIYLNARATSYITAPPFVAHIQGFAVGIDMILAIAVP